MHQIVLLMVEHRESFINDQECEIALFQFLLSCLKLLNAMHLMWIDRWVYIPKAKHRRYVLNCYIFNSIFAFVCKIHEFLFLFYLYASTKVPDTVMWMKYCTRNCRGASTADWSGGCCFTRCIVSVTKSRVPVLLWFSDCQRWSRGWPPQMSWQLNEADLSSGQALVNTLRGDFSFPLSLGKFILTTKLMSVCYAKRPSSSMCVISATMSWTLTNTSWSVAQRTC